MQGRKQAASAAVSCFSSTSKCSRSARQRSRSLSRQVVLARGSHSLTTHHLHQGHAASVHLLLGTQSCAGQSTFRDSEVVRAERWCAYLKRRSRDAMIGS